MAAQMADPAAPAAGAAVTGAVVVNYGGAADTIACVASLLAADPRPELVAVVENGSPDDSAEQLMAWVRALPEPGRVLREGALDEADRAWLAAAAAGTRVALLLAVRNHGFGGGVNAGWRVLRTVDTLTHVLLINNDATVSRDFLGLLLEAMRDEGVGIATGTVRYAPPREGVWFAGGTYRWAQCRGIHLTEGAGSARDVSFVTGCLMLVRAGVMDRLDGLPDCYFLYQEDTEFCLRVRAAGYRLRYAPASVVFHKVSASAGLRRTSPWSAFLGARNRLWFARRNLGGTQRVVAIPNVLADEVGRALGALKRGDGAVAAAVARGMMAGLFRSWNRESGPEGAVVGRT